MDIKTALDWANERRTGTLITIRRDGRPQSSDVAYAVADGVVRISLTASRAKTKNLVRDPRALLHISAPDAWSYVSIDGTVALSPIAVDAGDATCSALAEVYRKIAGEHDDWDDFFAAMIREQRQVATFTPGSVTGQINS